MGARRVRVALVFVLLAMTFASVAAAGAEERSHDAADLSAFNVDGFQGRLASGKARAVFSTDAERAALEARWRASDESRAPQVIVGDDSRAQVTDTTIFPYSAIAQLIGIDENMPDGTFVSCTGAFVGPNVLLTAAHCLWDGAEWGGWIDGLLVIPGANGQQTPFGVLSPAVLWIPDAYVSDSAPGSLYDYALVVLAETDTEAATGSFEIGVLTTAELTDPNFNPTTAGYPGDKPLATQWVSNETAFQAVDDGRLTHTIDSIVGQSGSPVWRGSDYTLVGVESTETETANHAMRLDVPIIYELVAACEDLGCRINHYLTDIPGDGGAYERVWARTDLPVASGTTARTWMWGPAPITRVMLEPYAEAPNGFRTVLYQEKSRMEITAPSSDPNSVWYVTNGLATVELMTGRLQLGDNTFEQYEPAQINVAGDQNDPNGATYATFAGLRSLPPHGGVPQGSEPGPVITATVDRAGTVGDDPSLAGHGVTADHYVPETGHRVASVFWQFMNSTGTVWQGGQYVDDLLFESPFFATGLPITEAYWTTVQVGGTPRTVLVQAFERRVLTYTPGNPEGFLVEAGNVGAHYYHWRYELIPPQLPDAPPGNGGGEPVDPPPAIGELIAEADFAAWPELGTTFGDVGGPVGDAYQITNPPTGFMQVIPESQFADGYFSLEARATQTSAAGAACLVYRADVNDENPLFNDFGYWFCLYYEGPELVAVVVVYETSAGIIELGGAEFFEPYPQASGWHQIGVVAQAKKFWFVVDDQVIGSMTHDLGPGSGRVGILSLNLDDAEGAPDATFQFRNLQIYALAP